MGSQGHSSRGTRRREVSWRERLRIKDTFDDDNDRRLLTSLEESSKVIKSVPR